ncbi:MAG TPA: hydroxyacid dehydrogenase [Firmicutes bacterium]|nr:hydroxyacid dehydrogenase [Bacillota bacterium]
MRKRVLIVQPIHKSGVEILEPHFEVKVAPDPSVDTVIKEIKGVHGVIVRTAPFTRAIIEAADSLMVIARHGVGVDNIDVAFATERGIPVANTPYANTISVAEHVIALMTALAKQLPKYDAATREGQFEIRNTYSAVDLDGKTLGIIGLGRIGRELAAKCAAAFNMKVVAYDPYVGEDIMRQANVTNASSLDELLRQADFVSIHVPLVEETRGMIGARELALMKPTAFLINAARGGIVDENALAEALRNRQLAGAGIDVFAEEPPGPQNPLFNLDNVILTPHSGALTRECVVRMATGAAEAVRDVLLGGRARYVVNPEVYGK